MDHPIILHFVTLTIFTRMLALFIAELTDYGHHFIPTLLTNMILGGLLAVPYAVWSRHQLTWKQLSG